MGEALTPLAAFRRSAGMTADQMAKRASMSRANYYRIEAGTIWPSRDGLIKLLALVVQLGGALGVADVLYPKGLPAKCLTRRRDRAYKPARRNGSPISKP
jgi:transcriptional regulator with XRE-family HTH domain